MLFPRQLILAFVIGLLLVVLLGALAERSILLLVLLLLIPLTGVLLARNDTWWMTVIATFASYLSLPQLPQGMPVHYALAAGLVALTIGRAAITRSVAPEPSLARVAIMAFMATMFMVMIYRGTGLRVLGSEDWGGSSYVQLCIAGLLALNAQHLVLSRRQWTVILIVMCLMSTLPFIAEVVSLFAAGSTRLTRLFINTNTITMQSWQAITQSRELLRFQSGMVASFPLFVAATLVYLVSGWRRLGVLVFLVVSSLLLAGLSGHRVAILSIVIFVFVVDWLWRHDLPFIVRLRVPAAALAALLIAALFASHLPSSFQRSLSWIPFADVDATVRADASGTSAWRLQMWRYLLYKVPDHLWMGRGYSFSLNDLAVISEWYSRDTQDFITTHDYHSGPLSLLIDTGLPGTVSAVLFLFGAIARHFRLSRQSWKDSSLRTFHTVILAWFVTKTLTFFIVFGDARNLTEFMFLWTLMESLHYTDIRTDESEPATQTP